MDRSESPSISVSRRGSARGETDCTVVWVRGEHDIATKVSVAVTIARAAQLDDVPVLVDLSAVTFMDASTVGAIVGSRNRLRLRARSLELRAPSPRALRILELCRLTGLIRSEPVHSTGQAAALATWVDVVPVGAAREDATVRAPVTARGLVAVSRIEEATMVEADRAGP